MPKDNPATLTIVGDETTNGTVSADVLLRVVSGLQRLALLFGAQDEGATVRDRFKPTEEQRQRYRLRIGIPQAGSYELPLTVVDERLQPQLPIEEPIEQRIRELFAAAGTGDEGVVRDLLPDSRLRERALRELGELGPKPGERWSGSLGFAGQTASLNGAMGRHVRQWLAAGLPDEATMTVTGELTAIQFDRNVLTVRYPVTKRAIECSYLPEIEDEMLESRRGPVQVTGQFMLDEDGHPKQLTDVRFIRPVDLSALVFERIEYAGCTLEADPPLEFAPRLDEDTEQLFLVTDESLDLHVFAPTREELVEELADHIIFAWQTYAEEDPVRLTPAAQSLREVYRNRFRAIVPSAAGQGVA